MRGKILFYLRKDKGTYIFLLLIILLGSFFRLYQLGNVPRGLTNDEGDILYDAYSFLLTGKDQWGHTIGTVLQGFGDYRLALYTYFVIPFVKLFDLTNLAVRLPSAIAGILLIPTVFLLARKWFRTKIALFASLLFAINPWLIGLSRIGIDSNIALFFLISGFVCFSYGRISKLFLFIGILFFALCMYTYTSYTLFIPLVLTGMGVMYRKFFLKIKKTTFLLVILFILLILPLFVFTKSTSGTRFSQVGLFTNVSSIGIINILNNQRGACQKIFPSILCKSFDSKPVTFSEALISNYIAHFSFIYLYREGNPTQYSILPQQGLFYLFELILLFIGLVNIFTKRIRQGLLTVFFLLLAPIADSLTGIGHYSRASVMVSFFLLIESIGFSYVYEYIVKMKNSLVKSITILLGAGIMLFSCSYFYINYFSYFSYYYSSYSEYGYIQTMQAVATKEQKYDVVYISRYLHDTKQYIYYLIATHYDPKKFQKKQDISYTIGSDGWISVNRVGNILFVDHIPHTTSSQSHSLFVADPKEFSTKVVPVTKIFDPLGFPTFYLVDSSEKNLFSTDTENL